MKVKITRSNCTFVRVGDTTEISRFNGRDRMWSERLNAYESLSWVTGMWGVQYEEVKQQESTTK